MGKINWRPFKRSSRWESPGDARAGKENSKFTASQKDWEEGQRYRTSDVQKEGGGMQSGQGSCQVWEPWMQKYFQDANQRKMLQCRQQLAVLNMNKFGFRRRRQSHTLTRYFQSSPRNLASPRLNGTGYMKLPQAQSPTLNVSRPTLASIANTPRRFGSETTNTLKMLKSVIKTPSNILKRLQGNVRVQLRKAKRLFQGATRYTGGESLADVLTREGVEVGLLLEPLLQMPGQLKREACEDEGEWQEMKMVRRPYRKVEEEVEDLMSPDWREMKEVSPGNTHVSQLN